MAGCWIWLYQFLIFAYRFTLLLFFIVIILFSLSYCVQAYQLFKKLEITTPLLFSHIHTNSIHPTDSLSKCKTNNMPQNNLIIVGF